MTPEPASVLTDAVRVRELARVLRACEDAGAMPVVFKGAALAHTHYAASWYRPRADADVLIAPDSRERVFGVLRGLGYERCNLISGDLVMYQAAFDRVDRLGIEHALDIHWRIANPQVVSQVLSHHELVERSVTVRIEDYPMRVPSAVDSLILACVHRVAHHPDLEKPFWIEDIHLLASRLEPSEWQTFVARAADRSICAICVQGLTRAQERFETPLPADVLTTLSETTSEPSALFMRRGLRPVDRLVSDLRTVGPFAAVSLMREHLFPPTTYMRAKYGITGGALLPAYYVARLVSGMSKWFRAYRAA
jgi:hypothetical protein